MDKIDDILRRVAAGEMTPDQAKERLKPKRGRPKKYLDRSVQPQDGEAIHGIRLGPLKSMALETPRNLAIGEHYVDQVESGIRPMMALRKTLEKYHTKRSPLSAGTVQKYATVFRKRRQRHMISHKGMLEAIRKGMDQLSGVALARKLFSELPEDQE